MHSQITPPTDLVQETASPSRPFVPAVDTIRLLAAVWVVFYHGAAPPLAEMVGPHLRRAADVAARLPFNGNAAVVVFFVLSGFCIHLGNVGKGAVSPVRFIVQRALRIVPPLVAAMALCTLAGPAYRAALGLVLWSVVCELAYYLVYPFAFPALRSDRIVPALCASIALSAVMAALQPGLKFLWQFYDWTPLFCLPMWLVGCLLADRYRTGTLRLPRLNIWLLRGGVIAAGAVTALLSNLPGRSIGYIWTMIPFAFLAAIWIWNEIEEAKAGRVSYALERAGLAGYSIYLVHRPVMAALTGLGAPWYALWPAKLAAVALASTVFYLVVERPSHRLSRRAGQALRRRPALAVEQA